MHSVIISVFQFYIMRQLAIARARLIAAHTLAKRLIRVTQERVSFHP